MKKTLVSMFAIHKHNQTIDFINLKLISHIIQLNGMLLR